MLEESKAIARKFYKMMELGDSGWVDEVVATDYDSHSAVPDPRMDIERIA